MAVSHKSEKEQKQEVFFNGKFIIKERMQGLF